MSSFDYYLDPRDQHCFLCGDDEMTCECSSIEGVMCQHCETILYTPCEEPSWVPCECGKTLHDFIKEVPKPGRGYITRYVQI